jgi:hypothetical protein
MVVTTWLGACWPEGSHPVRRLLQSPLYMFEWGEWVLSVGGTSEVSTVRPLAKVSTLSFECAAEPVAADTVATRRAAKRYLVRVASS